MTAWETGQKLTVMIKIIVYAAPTLVNASLRVPEL